MSESNDRRPRDTRPLVEKATSVVSKLRDAGHEAYFAGGCVRDQLMGVPSHDYDIATDATPDEVQALFPRTLAIGAQFGVIQVRYGGEGFEVTTFRTDVSYSDGRRPDQVQFVSAEEDVQRRDFTINGLLQDPLSGEVIDHVGGVGDIEAQCVRAIGDAAERFAEDRLRMLRAVRFASRFGFTIHAETVEAIQRDAAGIIDVSPERIRDELSRTFSEGDAGAGYTELRRLGLLTHVLPEIPSDDPRATEDAAMLADLPMGDAVAAFALLLRDADDSVVEGLGKRLRMSNADTEYMRARVAGPALIEALDWSDRAAWIRWAREPHAEAMLDQCDRLPDATQAQRSRLAEIRALLAGLTPEELRPKPWLTGHDLMEFGHTPGPHFKTTLAQLEDAQLRGELTDRESAEELAARLLSSPH
jgi:tRNA nucleotidyltransferase/poly(A) polymerase